ncbi:MAG: hypothetical protein R3E48_17690 [Burkholderiaceae bacterium]
MLRYQAAPLERDIERGHRHVGHVQPVRPVQPDPPAQPSAVGQFDRHCIEHQAIAVGSDPRAGARQRQSSRIESAGLGIDDLHRRAQRIHARELEPCVQPGPWKIARDRTGVEAVEFDMHHIASATCPGVQPGLRATLADTGVEPDASLLAIDLDAARDRPLGRRPAPGPRIDTAGRQRQRDGRDRHPCEHAALAEIERAAAPDRASLRLQHRQVGQAQAALVEAIPGGRVQDRLLAGARQIELQLAAQPGPDGRELGQSAERDGRQARVHAGQIEAVDAKSRAAKRHGRARRQDRVEACLPRAGAQLGKGLQARQVAARVERERRRHQSLGGCHPLRGQEPAGELDRMGFGCPEARTDRIQRAPGRDHPEIPDAHPVAPQRDRPRQRSDSEHRRRRGHL